MPSFVKTIERKGVKPMMLITCMIYFKYRIINKIMVMNISVELGYNFGVYYKILIFIRVAF